MRGSAARSESSEALRGKVYRVAVGSGGECWERPVEVSPGIDLVQLAGADDRIDDGWVVAGVGVADEEPVAQTKFCWANLPLNRVVIDLDVAVARLSEETEFGPAGEAVVDGLGEVALGKDRGIRACRAQAQVKLQEQGHGMLGPASGAGLRVQIPGLGLDLVELAEEDEKGGDAVVAALEGLHEAAARMGHARGPDDLVARQGLEGGVVGAEAVGLEYTCKALEELLRRGVATVFMKLEDDDLLLRGMDSPEPGVAGLARALGVEDRDGGLVHLDVAAGAGIVAQQGMDRLQQKRRVADPLAHGLAGEGGSQAGEHLFLAMDRQVVCELGDDHVGDETGADLARGHDPRRQGGDPRGRGMGGGGVDGPHDL